MQMANFSERYGYVKPIEVLKKGFIEQDLAKSLCSCYDMLSEDFEQQSNNQRDYEALELYLWVDLLHERKGDFYYGRFGPNTVVATEFLLDDIRTWYSKFDLIEKTLTYLRKTYFRGDSRDRVSQQIVEKFVHNINHFLRDLNYGYRVVDDIVVPITTDEEMKAVKHAIDDSKDNIRHHIHSSLELYSKRPEADYRNSIKESISAVEAFCREKTSESKLGTALKKLEVSGVVIPNMLKTAFEKLYAYTNQPDSGIRHALMDPDGDYVPGQEEALFMLVSCSAFLNYLYGKMAK